MQERTNSAVLRAKMRLFAAATDEAYRAFWALPEPAKRYPRFLIQLHQIVRASVPLMEAARRRASELAGEDPVAARLVGYYDEHINDERGHDTWILEDLELIGVRREHVLALTPSPRVAALVGAHYYWILHHHPAALLAYIALLEEPPSLAALDDLRARTGYPEAAFRTLREHGTIDPHHGAELDRFLDALPLSPAHHEILGVSVVFTTSALEDCIRELGDARAG